MYNFVLIHDKYLICFDRLETFYCSRWNKIVWFVGRQRFIWKRGLRWSRILWDFIVSRKTFDWSNKRLQRWIVRWKLTRWTLHIDQYRILGQATNLCIQMDPIFKRSSCPQCSSVHHISIYILCGKNFVEWFRRSWKNTSIIGSDVLPERSDNNNVRSFGLWQNRRR